MEFLGGGRAEGEIEVHVCRCVCGCGRDGSGCGGGRRVVGLDSDLQDRASPEHVLSSSCITRK